MKKLIILFVALFSGTALFCQQASISEKTMTFRTYGYSDPDPVPRPGNIYPYYRFDGYASEPVQKDWKIIVLENQWIKVLIAPEIGGKILGAIEKSTGNEFLYFNKVIKFRDVAMRGPWTSGGIEFNFGSIGHAPTTSSKVDYLMQENPDGSVSCFLGAMDLSSRTEWRVEVRLPDDKAWFETHAQWFNPTDLSTSKYHWMNAAADATSDLTYYWPGTHYIGHGGDSHAWPILVDGRNISRYEENDYGTYHSYHVLGEIKDYYAGYYANRQFGFGHLSDYAIKPGKKIWIWGLSRQGEIWVDLLTDPDLGNGQYTEIQTGLLFNQAAANSTQTPYKHLGFQSQENERFTELWFPILGTGGVSDVNQFGIIQVEDPGTKIQDPNLTKDIGLKTENQVPSTQYHLKFCALQEIQDSIWVQVNDSLWISFFAEQQPMETREYTSLTTFSSVPSSVDSAIRFDLREKVSDRPTQSPSHFDWNSIQGKYLAALENARQRNYKQALEGFSSCLEDDQNYIPALNGAAEELIRVMKYEQAENLLQRVLSINTYDPKANYLYGIVKKIRGEYPRAHEAFGLATRSMEFRAAGFVQLAEVAVLMKDYPKALGYANSALDYNRFNIKAYQLITTANRLLGNEMEAFHSLEVLIEMDPLNHQARFEAWLLSEDPEALIQFKKHITNEFPEQSYLELALFYANLGLTNDAQKVLSQAPKNQLITYLTNYLNNTLNHSKITTPQSPTPQSPTPQSPIPIPHSPLTINPYTFPYRPEMYKAIAFAEQQSPHWQNRYYLGLMQWNFNQLSEARQYFRSCGDEPDQYGFYLARTKLFSGVDTELVVHDLERALKLAPDTWRPYKYLVDFYMKNHLYSQALEFAKQAGKKFKDNFIIQADLAKIELYNDHYKKSLNILENLENLPAEGATAGHNLYRQAHLMLAVEAFKSRKSELALEHIAQAREWPENLGVGKPYVTDERIENYLEGIIRMHEGQDDRAAAAFRRILRYTEKVKPSFDSPYLLLAYSLQFLGLPENAIQLLSDWVSNNPADPIAQWAISLYGGNPDQAERALNNYRDSRGDTPWNPTGTDRQFRLVYEIVNQIQLK